MVAYVTLFCLVRIDIRFLVQSACEKKKLRITENNTDKVANELFFFFIPVSIAYI